MADTINVDANGRQTNISQPGKPVTQGAKPNPDNAHNVVAHWNETQGTIVIGSKKYSLTFIGNV